MVDGRVAEDRGKDPMTRYDSEADARIIIDEQLRAAGWNPADKSQVRTEIRVSDVGPDGERVDKRDYVTDCEQTVRKGTEVDPLIAKIKDDEPLTEQEENELAQHPNQPDRYFNEDNLRHAYRDPGGNLIDFIRAALGLLKPKSREERVEENFRAWLVARNLSPEQAQYLALLKNRGLVKGQVSLDDLFNPPLSILNAASMGIELFGEQGLKQMVEEINRSVLAAQ